MPRYPIPDALRGFSLLSMAGFHLTWDLIWLFGVRLPAGSDALLYLWQQSICWSFIFLSGFSLPFGRRPFRRGGELFCCGAAVAAVSFLLSSLELTDGPPSFRHPHFSRFRRHSLRRSASAAPPHFRRGRLLGKPAPFRRLPRRQSGRVRIPALLPGSSRP